MKVTIHMKSPDAVGDAVREACVAESSRIAPGADDDQREILFDDIEQKMDEKLKKWIEFGEYITVEFDLDSMTAAVKEVR